MTSIYGLTGTRLPIHPQPRQDELLTHWFLRLAHANGLKAQGLADYAFGHPSSFWARDQDRYPTLGVVERIAELTGRDPGDVSALTLAGHKGVNPTDEGRVHLLPWVLPVGVYHRTRRNFGMQFCPYCLMEDSIPYFRRRWRLAFATICDRHGSMLHDRCPECGASVAAFRNDIGHWRKFTPGDYTLCWKCGFDLRRAPVYCAPGPDGLSLVAQRSLVTFHDLGWWFLSDNTTIPFACQYLDVLRHLLLFLDSTAGHRLLNFIAQQTGWEPAIAPKPGRRVFELLPVMTRHRRLVSAFWLLNEWPERFIRAATTVRITQSMLLRSATLPFWFESVVRFNLDGVRNPATAEEAGHAARYLARCGKVSRGAVGRLLGSKDAEAAKPYAMRWPSIRDTDLQRWIDEIGREIAGMPPTRVRYVLERDRTIFRVMLVTGWPARQILAMTVRDAVRIAVTPAHQRTHPGALAGILLGYLQRTRRLLAGTNSGDALFIGWRRGRIGEKDFGLRVQRARGLLPPRRTAHLGAN